MRVLMVEQTPTLQRRSFRELNARAGLAAQLLLQTHPGRHIEVFALHDGGLGVLEAATVFFAKAESLLVVGRGLGAGEDGGGGAGDVRQAAAHDAGAAGRE